MKRKEIDRRLTQLLDRIDGELAEIRDGLIEVDHRAAKVARDQEDYGQLTVAACRRLDDRVSDVEALLRAVTDHSRKGPS